MYLYAECGESSRRQAMLGLMATRKKEKNKNNKLWGIIQWFRTY